MQSNGMVKVEDVEVQIAVAAEGRKLTNDELSVAVKFLCSVRACEEDSFFSGLKGQEPVTVHPDGFGGV